LIKTAGLRLLTEIESKELLSKAGIPVVEAKLASSMKAAVDLSCAAGFPVVMKIASPDIVHKSDAGGVKLGLENKTQVERAYREMMASVRLKMPAARIDGVSIQKMAKPGIDLIIGTSQDPQFGPVLMFGLGGILVEIIKDVSFRLIPLARRDAAQMVREIKGFPLLQGYRGQAPLDLDQLEKLILSVSDLVAGKPQIKELDLNPVFGYADGLVAVDARIVMEV
jgi:acyl-CoA synthetase (NDP forming)